MDMLSHRAIIFIILLFLALNKGKPIFSLVFEYGLRQLEKIYIASIDSLLDANVTLVFLKRGEHSGDILLKTSPPD